ncbi:MAG: NAD(P)/FAD-dependent oxidoreductase [Candidatus Azotimanducaceae bacterium]
MKICVIGAGYTGLSAAHELTKLGHSVSVIEADEKLGGLAGYFKIGHEYIEKYYHHWFTSDLYILDLIKELGLDHLIESQNSRTGVYFNNNFYKLSRPVDLLTFTPLSPINRLRLGFLILRVRMIKDWKPLENLTAVEWLKALAGDRVFEVVWLPLLKGKFGDDYRSVSAVWFWNKLKLRGGSRTKTGSEQLLYLKGGFKVLQERIENMLSSNRGKIVTGSAVKKINALSNGNLAITTADGQQLRCDKALFTGSSHQLAKILENSDPSNSHKGAQSEYINKLRNIKYLGNVCIVLELSRSLSDLYWLSVNDPSFPFVAVIEHTNFVSKERYNNTHIVYLSRYVSNSDPMYKMNDKGLRSVVIACLSEMFFDFSDEHIINMSVWRAKYSQPLVTPNFSKAIPPFRTPTDNLYFASMCQIYPEDRGTNYAVREGQQAAKLMFR